MKNLILIIFLLSAFSSKASEKNNEWIKGCFFGAKFFIEFTTRQHITKQQSKELLNLCINFKLKIDAAQELSQDKARNQPAKKSNRNI